MGGGPDLTPFFIQQLWTIPQFIAYGVGILMALIYWKRHPTISACAGGAFLLFGIVQILSIVMIFVIVSGGGRGELSDVIQPVINLVRILGNSIAWGLLIYAVFGSRSAQHTERNFL